MLTFVLLLIVILIVGYLIMQRNCNKHWHEKPLRNFPFMHKGKLFWYSRAVTVTNVCFSKNSKGEWVVLANKRGSGAPDYAGYWNCPCGYLDFDEDGQESAQRETFEETSVFVPKNKLIFYKVKTSPLLNKQNVSIIYYSILDGNCEDYELGSDFSEKNEVSEIEWVSIDNNYNWAFNHDVIINQIYNEVIKNQE